MQSTLFSQYPLMSALVWGSSKVRVDEKYAVPTRMPMRAKYNSELPPCTVRKGLFHEGA